MHSTDVIAKLETTIPLNLTTESIKPTETTISKLSLTNLSLTTEFVQNTKANQKNSESFEKGSNFSFSDENEIKNSSDEISHYDNDSNSDKSAETDSSQRGIFHRKGTNNQEISGES